MIPRLGYRGGSSAIHRLHPLLKVAWLAAITAAVFLIQSPLFSLGLAAVILAAFPASGIRVSELRGLKIMLLTAVLICLLQLIFLKEGTSLIQLGGFLVTDLGLARGVYLGSRFLVVILASYLFVLTTSPNQLAYAMMRAGVPYRLGFAFVTALRMIPIFEGEARVVYQAGQVRGVDYRPKNVRDLGNKLTGFIMPMLISAMSKVDALSISMEGRCFGKYRDRTYFKIRESYPGDLWAGLALILGIAMVTLLKVLEV